MTTKKTGRNIAKNIAIMETSATKAINFFRAYHFFVFGGSCEIMASACSCCDSWELAASLLAPSSCEEPDGEGEAIDGDLRNERRVRGTESEAAAQTSEKPLRVKERQGSGLYRHLWPSYIDMGSTMWTLVVAGPGSAA